jgi:hypothetical protein
MVKKEAQLPDISDLNLGDMQEFLIPMFDDFEDMEVEIDEDENSIKFIIDTIPGAPDAVEIEEELDENVEIEEEAENDPWKWQHETFIDWLKDRCSKVPKHSGYATTGLEKAISYFESLNKEISKAMRTDYKDQIDYALAEQAREEIEQGLEALINRLNQVQGKKFKKKSWAESAGFVKEAKSTKITGITITVPLLISRIARVCINGMVSAGHDMEDMFDKQAEEYKLDKREKAELAQLLEDMGYPLLRDRGIEIGKPIHIERSDNFDWSAQYRG